MPAYVTQAASGKLASYDGETMIAMHVDADGKAAIEAAALANGTVDISTLSELTSFELARTTFTAEADVTLGKIDVAADEDPFTDTDGETVAGVVIARQTGGSDAARTVVACHTFTPRAGNVADAIVFSNEAGFGTWTPAPGAIVRGIGTVRPDAEGIVNSEELAALVGAYLDGSGEGVTTAGSLIADADMSGGTFTTVTLVKPNGTTLASGVPRAAFVDSDVAVLSGDDGGKVWNVTSSGPCTLVRACDAGEPVSVFGGVQRYVVQASNEAISAGLAGPGAADRFVPFDASSIDLSAIESSIGSIEGDIEAAVTAAEAATGAVEASIVPVVERFGAAVEIDSPRFDLGAPELSSYTSGTYATTPPIDQFTDGFWAEAVIEIDESRFIADPPDGELEYLEITSQAYTAGDEGADIFEWAVESEWRDARWHHFLYYEHTPVGSLTDSYKVSGRVEGGLELPTGTPVRVAVWCEFDTGSGQSRTRLLVEAPEGRSGVEARGRTWRVDVDRIEDATDIEENSVDDWWIGAGNGRLLTPGVTIIDGGPTGTVVASPSATDAWAEGEGNPFDDAQANTWTPDTNAGLVDAPAPSGGGVALGETSTTAYRGDRGKTAYDHSQTTGNPHGTTAADVGAAATSHSHAASDITSGTLDIARIPTGTSSSTVAIGNDARFTQVLGGQDEGTAATSSSTTSLLDSTITLSGLNAGDAIDITASMRHLNNSGSSRSHTIAVKIGATTVATLTTPSMASSASYRFAVLRATIRVEGASDQNTLVTHTITGLTTAADGSASTENLSSGAALDLTGAVGAGGSQEIQLLQLSVARSRA